MFIEKKIIFFFFVLTCFACMASDNDFDDVMLAIRNGKYNHNNFFHKEKKTLVRVITLMK